MPDKADEEVIIDFGKKKKKKEKKEKKEKKDKGDAAENEVPEENEKVGVDWEQGKTWSYEDLLERLHTTMNNLNTMKGIKEKYVMKTPQVSRCGSKKSQWVNFKIICDLMKRTPEHVMQYAFTELGCEGNMAGEGALIMKGKFMQKNIEVLLRKYIGEYVQCKMCRSTDTVLTKDVATRLYQISCNNCGAYRTCTKIESGYTATRKGERRKARNAGDKIQVVG